MNDTSTLEARLRDTETLLEIGVELASTLDPERVLELALANAERLCQAETSSIWEVDADNGELFFRVVRGRAAHRIRDLRVKLGEGVVGSVARSGLAELVDDARADPRWGGEPSVDFETRAMIVVPLVAHGRVIGVLQVLNPLSRSVFSADDLRRMELFGGILAHAIENARLYEQQRQTFLETVTALAEAVDKRDPYTGGHVRRVVTYSLLIGAELGLDPERMEELRLAAALHDIGKIGVPDQVLQKSSALNEEEQSIMRRHVIDGAEIVAPIKRLRSLLAGIRHHHERLDGSGYPDGLRGGDIPLVARIIAVADTYDAVTTDRPYRRGRAPHEALAEIEAASGRQFCPDVVAAFKRVFPTLSSARDRAPA